MAVTVTLHGPSTNGLLPRITPEALAAVINTALAAIETEIGALSAAPGPIGSTTPNTGAFTTLSASGTVSGAGFVAWSASPGPIGSTEASAGHFTTLSATGSVSGAGFVALHASPGPIGTTVASTGHFTDVQLPAAGLSDDGSAGGFNVLDGFGNVLLSVGATGVAMGAAAIDALTATTADLASATIDLLSLPNAVVSDDPSQPSGLYVFDAYRNLMMRVDAAGITAGAIAVALATIGVATIANADVTTLSLPATTIADDPALPVAFNVFDAYRELMVSVDETGFKAGKATVRDLEVSGAITGAGTAGIGGIAIGSTINLRGPTAWDDSIEGWKVGDLWIVPDGAKAWVATDVTPNAAVWQSLDATVLPLDAAAASGYEAEGWWGTRLATSNPLVVAYNKCVDVWRSSDRTTQTFGFNGRGEIDADAIDAFAAGSASAEIVKVYDQSFVIATGALKHNDATATAGFRALSAAVVSGGVGTPGTYEMTVTGGTGVAAKVTGTVTGTALAGALTITEAGSYSILPVLPAVAHSGTSTVNVSGGTFSVQPTIAVTWYQRAPLWTKNRVNKRRCLTFQVQYSPNDPTFETGTTGGQDEWLDIPTGCSVIGNAWTMFNAVHLQSSFQVDGFNVLAAIGLPASGLIACADGDSESPTPGYADITDTDTPMATISSPSVWTWQPSASDVAVTIGNAVGSVPAAFGGGVKLGGSIGGGLSGGGRFSSYDFLSLGLFDATLSDAAMRAVKASLNVSERMVPQARDLLVCCGDSIGFGATSKAGNNWSKLLLAMDLLPSHPEVSNISISGGQFHLGTVGYNDVFTTVWQALYSSDRRIFVVCALGTNDMATGADAAECFALAVTYATSLAALGDNVHLIMTTVLPRSLDLDHEFIVPLIDEYNQMLRTLATLPIADGGLGAVALIDWEDSPVWTNGTDVIDKYTVGGTHPTDIGYVIMARTAAPIINAVLSSTLL